MPKYSQADPKKARMKKCNGQSHITCENQNRNAQKQFVPNNDV